MALDVGIIVGDSLLATGTLGAAVVAAVAAVRAGKARDAGHENRTTLGETMQTLQRIEKNTDGRLDEKITRAVEQVARQHPDLFGQAVYHEALRDLLDAFIGASLTDDEFGEHEQHRRRLGPVRRPDRHDG